MPDRPLTRLLVVEDDADTANLVSMALGHVGGYVVKACASAREGLAAARSFRPDLILLDVMMPGTDGVAAFRRLRQLEATRETPVVFMTAMAEPNTLLRDDEPGCLGVIPKPFDPLTLADTLEALWGRGARPPGKPFPGEFEALRQTYIDELPGRIASMKATADALASDGWNRERLLSLYQDTHRLAGSAGLFRMAQLSRTAGVLEEIVKLLLTNATWPPASSPAEFTTLVKAVGRTARFEARRGRPPLRES